MAFPCNEGERVELENPTIQACRANDPEAVTQDRHTHSLRIKNKNLSEEAEEEQKANIKGADKHQRVTLGKPQ